MTQWSPQQEKALAAVGAWLKAPSAPQVFRLFGYAGTGKTTLAKHLAEDAGRVLFGAYTGKAAHVLRKKGCPAQTIHSLIYLPRGKSRARLDQMREQLAQTTDEKRRAELEVQIRAESESLKRPHFELTSDSPVSEADLVIIDECSMVDSRMADDLLSFDTKVLVLGDPAQLPPVRGSSYFTDAEPDFLLTEVHRQAKDNPVLALATTVREGGRLKPGSYGDSLVTDTLDAAQALAADQILVGRNTTRRKVNDRMRQLRGFSGPIPGAGERLVCLRNNHDLGLLNGSIWHVQEVYGDIDPVPMSIRPEGETWTQEVMAHRRVFAGEDLEWYERLEAEEFDFGYALTVHKSQGSEWDRVMVLNESGAFRSAARQWLYTAITRAAQSVVVKI